MAEEGIAAEGVMDVNTALQESGAKPIFVCLHPTVMSLYMSNWWRPFVLNTKINLIKVDDKK
ncbi:hypothetical protein GH733_008842 [Mirounga leonina]|nr:hypothetical protein GH733_008842 [Mirounga leonina]